MVVCGPGAGDCGGDASNGCEADLFVDGEHCGACGHSCQSGVCGAGECGAVKLAAGDIGGMALDGAYVYYVDFAGTTKGMGSVRRIKKSGGTPEVLVAGETYPRDVAVDGTHVYWVTGYKVGAPSLLRRALKNGGSATTLHASEGDLSNVAVDASGIYFTDASSGEWTLQGIFPDAAAPKPISSDMDGSARLAIDATHVYWLGGLALKRAPKAASSAAPETVQPVHVPFGLALFGDSVFWTDEPTNGKDGVFTSPKSGGPRQLVAESYNPRGLAVDGSGVYWANLTPRSIELAPHAGPKRTLPLGTNQYPGEVEADADTAYFTVSGSNRGLYKVAK